MRGYWHGHPSRRLLGHADIRTTMRCVHVAEEEPHEGVG
jgi:hypothetical protein